MSHGPSSRAPLPAKGLTNRRTAEPTLSLSSLRPGLAWTPARASVRNVRVPKSALVPQLQTVQSTMAAAVRLFGGRKDSQDRMDIERVTGTGQRLTSR
jgi:hypothetical protein